MTSATYAPPATALSAAPAFPIQRYARIIGVLVLLSIIFGYIGEMAIPSSFILPADTAGTTLDRIAASESLFRAGFAAYLVEAVCDVSLALLFYVLLKPVSRPLALASAFFGLVSTALYAVAEMFYFLPTVWLGHPELMHGFSPEQVNTLTVLSLKIFSRVGWMFVGFYGIASMLRGYLIYRSGFLPKWLGILLALGGAGFVLRNVTYILAPAYSSMAFVALMGPAGLALTGWMLVKGVDVARWAASQRGAA